MIWVEVGVGGRSDILCGLNNQQQDGDTYYDWQTHSAILVIFVVAVG